MGFPTKNDHFGVFGGYHHLRKHPFGNLCICLLPTNMFNTNRSFAKDRSDLRRFGEGLRTCATRTSIRGDATEPRSVFFVVEGGGCTFVAVCPK